MMKKKTKRVKARQVIGNEMTARRHRFYNTGAPLSILMLLAFGLAAGWVLSFTGPGAWATVTDRGRTDYLPVTGLVLLICLVMGMYVAVHESEVVKDHRRGAMLLLSFLVLLLLVRLGGLRAGLSPFLLVAPAMIAGIMLTIGFRRRFALGMGNFFVVFSAIALTSALRTVERTLAVLLTAMVGMAFVVLLLRDIRTRSRLLQVCLMAAVAVFATTWMVGAWRQVPVGQTWGESLYAAAGALSVGFLMQGLLPLVERMFGTATGMTLLDFGEQTNPLLKRLAVEAPGTFNHSWQIGMLAEAAAEAIGANGLLCRVGSYYHDVGKLNKPRYFVENQAESFNQHKELSPTMSRMIIVGHVKDGIELARQYHLPKVLHQFIATHHGTTLVEYFYHEATKQSSESGQPIAETEFRYPGPKPQTKEAALVMLADAVEGATRALQEPTPSRIEALVHSIAMKRLQDGQFDECDLTMRDLCRLEASLTKSLCGMYHGRIAYPKTEQEARLKLRRSGEQQAVV